MHVEPGDLHHGVGMHLAVYEPDDSAEALAVDAHALANLPAVTPGRGSGFVLVDVRAVVVARAALLDALALL